MAQWICRINYIDEFAIELRWDICKFSPDETWLQPIVTQSVGGKVRLINATNLPHSLLPPLT